jgi:hypothetical protein
MVILKVTSFLEEHKKDMGMTYRITQIEAPKHIASKAFFSVLIFWNKYGGKIINSSWSEHALDITVFIQLLYNF